jgi:3,4-dihydroxy 2-butanone 4-phosphate synthase/GTP cyclohydrolase II
MSTTVERAPCSESVRFEVETLIPTRRGPLRVRAYRDVAHGADHLALVADPVGNTPLVRLHSECLTGRCSTR